MLMATLSDTRDNIWHEETLIELEYFASELFSSTEFSLLIIVLTTWIFLRVYWFGLSLIARFARFDID